MSRKRKKTIVPKFLIKICIGFGITMIIVGILNSFLGISLLNKLNGFIGAIFTISIISIMGLWLINQINKK